MTQTERGITLAAIVVGVVTGVVVMAAARQGANERQRQAEAVRQNGLRAAAGITGRYVGEFPYNEGEPIDTYQLAAFSSLIVVGSPVSNIGIEGADGRSVYSFYRVNLESVLKGEARPGDMLDVVVPGGRVGYSDGTWAQLNARGFFEPGNGRRYVWFLRRARPAVDSNRPQGVSGDVWGLTFGPLGLYDVSPDQSRVRPSGNRQGVFGREVVASQKKPDDFLGEIRRQLAER